MRNPFRSPLWSNNAFVRVWTAACISIFGSLITRIALPLVAILTLNAGPIEALVADRELGRVASTFQVLSAGAQLVATVGAGLLAEVIGLRATSFLAPLGGLLAGAILFWSPVRTMLVLPVLDHRSPAEAGVDAERDQPVGA